MNEDYDRALPSGPAENCPFCGKPPTAHYHNDSVMCENPNCPMCGNWIPREKWNRRPEEKRLRAKNARLSKRLAAAEAVCAWCDSELSADKFSDVDWHKCGELMADYLRVKRQTEL